MFPRCFIASFISTRSCYDCCTTSACSAAYGCEWDHGTQAGVYAAIAGIILGGALVVLGIAWVIRRCMCPNQGEQQSQQEQQQREATFPPPQPVKAVPIVATIPTPDPTHTMEDSSVLYA
ncbi:expressed unknown protein [Seminavis robusta]|uniref:Uncharacterized protein n=1 Tax=Seminavis robusta TaxID=568900 RepID=A0A9N8E0J3_9STRA|nr:expressed unknown protein [Seminavis robusta]|eukprot:Sro525_g160121.1  (120) ;mRNA; r:23587-23946